MKKINFVLAFAVVTAVAFTSACSKSDCEKLYEKTKKCSKGKNKMDISKGAFVELCKKMSDSKALKDELSCVSKSSCDDYNKCVKEKSEARYAKKELERMDKKISEKKYSDVVITCKYNKKNSLIDKKCKEVLPKACTALVEKAKKSKEGGKKDYSSCIYIKDCSKVTKDEKYNKDAAEACK
ncbi:MAG: hypothetical protein JXR95_00350 [Deltaproteobacteria bacterium]|nr:hypothetical protein [Deltaproteobacteria bacterium]